jgi:hypothetical protein
MHDKRSSISSVCLACGTTFFPWTTHPGQKFCTKRCYHAGRTRDVAERFWSLVDRSGECWLWVGSKGTGGYGHFFPSEGKLARAHRFAWELTHGPVPDGLCVLHDCPGGDNPACVRPEHLYLGTQQVNVDDMIAKGRQATGARLPHTKLTDVQVREIRTRHAAGEKVTALAKEFDVRHPCISRVVRGQRRKRVN